MLFDATKEVYEIVELKGKPMIFTNMRLDRRTIPKGLFAYDVRDDGSNGIPCEICRTVLVNHWGTIVTDEELSLDESMGNPTLFVEEDEFNYLGNSTTMSEFFKLAN